MRNFSECYASGLKVIFLLLGIDIYAMSLLNFRQP